MTGEDLQKAVRQRYLTIVADLPHHQSLFASHNIAIEAIGLELFPVIPLVVRDDFETPNKAAVARSTHHAQRPPA